MNELKNVFAEIGSRVGEWLTSPDVLRPVTGVLRRCAPTIVAHERALVTRHRDVVEVLGNDRDFAVTEIYDAKMRRTSGAFALGMENTEQYRRESAFIRSAVRDGDMDRIRRLVANHAEELVSRVQSNGRLDVVEGLTHLVPLRLLRDYFGTPGPDWPTLARWMRTIFWEIFLNLTDDADVSAAAARSSRELSEYLSELVERRHRELSEGKPLPDDFLSRLVIEGQARGFDGDAIRRNVGGVIVGAVDTQSKAMCHAIEQLLEHPEALASAARAAREGDRDSVAAHVWEALRFNPHNPILLRHCRRDAVVGEGTESATRIPAGTTVFVSTLSAMFDESVLIDPAEFRPGRPREHYLHFGHGQHRCFGERINYVVLPEVIQRLLLLPNLRVADGERIHYEGPFPRYFPLEFDRL